MAGTGSGKGRNTANVGKSTIINTEPHERWHPKGNGQNARTMEHYRQLGFSDEVRKLFWASVTFDWAETSTHRG